MQGKAQYVQRPGQVSEPAGWGWGPSQGPNWGIPVGSDPGAAEHKGLEPWDGGTKLGQGQGLRLAQRPS